MAENTRSAGTRLVAQLRRGLAGRKQRELDTLRSLGFRRRNQLHYFNNDAPTRGQLNKVSHLLSIRLLPHHRALSDTLHRMHNRPHMVISHSAISEPQQPQQQQPSHPQSQPNGS